MPNAELAAEELIESEELSVFDTQMTEIFAVIERLEDAVAVASKRDQAWAKEKKQLLDAQTKLEKKLNGAGDDVKFIKEHLDQSKKEKEQFQAEAKKERERIMAAAKKEQNILAAEIKDLRSKNERLTANMDKVTSKLDKAISKISELME